MQIERSAYIVDFNGKEVPKRLTKLDVNVAYVSKRAHYAIVYLDKAKGDLYLKRQLKQIKGFVGVYPSLFYHDEANIT